MNRMTTRLALLVCVALTGAVAPLLPAQDTQPRAAMLRRELEQRFAAQMREQLQLTGEQETKVRGIMSGFAERRRALEGEERAMRQALSVHGRRSCSPTANSEISTAISVMITSMSARAGAVGGVTTLPCTIQPATQPTAR